MSRTSSRLARFGLAAKGALYALLAVLALQIAFGNPADADSQGALQSVARRPCGAVMLGVLAGGFAGYAAWQGRCAVRGDEWFPRAAAAVRFVLWAGLAYTATRSIVTAGGGSNVERSMTARVLDMPLGPWVVGGGGLAVIAVGLSFLRHLRDDAYLDDLRPLPQHTRRTVATITHIGIGAKAGVYVLVGAFLVQAAMQHHSNSGVGLDGALSTVAQQPYGTYVLAAVAGGFAAYALWCWVRARYENVESSDG